MCRNIQQLRGAEPPATDAEVRDAALQFVRKVSGYRKPSAGNAEAFDDAVDEVSVAVRRLLDGLTAAPGARPVVPLQRRRAVAPAADGGAVGGAVGGAGGGLVGAAVGAAVGRATARGR